MSWAPDGHTLAAFGLSGGKLVTVDAQGGSGKLSIAGVVGINVTGLAWSRDQKKLYYARDWGWQQGEAALIERDLSSGAEREVLRRKSPMQNLTLSPDGQSLGFRMNDAATKTSAIFLEPVAGGEPKELVRRPGLGVVNFSPDGRYIATGTSDPATKTTGILLIPADGAAVKEYLRAADPLAVANPSWAPDSRSFLVRMFSAPDFRDQAFWRVPVDGGQPARLDVNANLEHVTVAWLSPDGQQMAILRGDQATRATQDVFVLENFLPVVVKK